MMFREGHGSGIHQIALVVYQSSTSENYKAQSFNYSLAVFMAIYGKIQHVLPEKTAKE